ncbi:hypothetical protein [Legionella jamestowniensis]|uniref:Uncharacterized protein n=2 Tax=Legionella jamestowniensis TaxID=455 RepID=A0ABX2XW37_9GAMM|nr:hypothetical protein [Legionella jamestowniensis]OCH98668.1 hypothetical protein A8135_10200 [Legionella jamestowniensis]
MNTGKQSTPPPSANIPTEISRNYPNINTVFHQRTGTCKPIEKLHGFDENHPEGSASIVVF